MNRRELGLAEIIIGVTATLVVVLLAKVGAFDLLYSFGGSLFAGIQQTSYNSFQAVSEQVNFLNNIAQIKADNEHLQEERDQLQVQNVKLLEQLKNNQLLNKQLEFDLPYTLIPARVIKYEDNQAEIFINKGSAQGVKVEMVAVVDNYAIGKVTQVLASTAKLKLISAVDSNLPVIVLENGVKGILNGDNSGDLLVSNIVNEKKLEIGQTIVTSGVNSNYPYGLFIGKIDTFQSQSSQIDQSATIITTIKLRDLSQVYLINR
jgi:rod shape-determining protein MreC